MLSLPSAAPRAAEPTDAKLECYRKSSQRLRRRLGRIKTDDLDRSTAAVVGVAVRYTRSICRELHAEAAVRRRRAAAQGGAV
jgi:hypothetical protein